MLREIVDSYMLKVPEVREYCSRCLNTQRWEGSVLLMIVDAAFTSIGLNYFQAVVPKVETTRKTFLEKGIKTLEDFLKVRDEELLRLWKNKRSWQVTKAVVHYLVKLKKERGLDDRGAFIYWAQSSQLENWRGDPIGGIKGVGINTFQYLRMMGGVDTVMPDKVVKRVIGEILAKAGMEMPADDLGFINLVEKIARDCGYRAIELCWMTWLLQSEAGLSRAEKYAELLPRI